MVSDEDFTIHCVVIAATEEEAAEIAIEEFDEEIEFSDLQFGCIELNKKCIVATFDDPFPAYYNY